MSARDYQKAGALSVVGVGTPYHTIKELFQDRERVQQLADALEISHRNIHKDGCGQWTISGKWGYLQTWGNATSYLFYYVAHSERKWGAVKRKASSLGWQVTEDGDDQGCFRLELPNTAQSECLRQLLGLRRKPRPTSNEIVSSEGVLAA